MRDLMPLIIFIVLVTVSIIGLLAEHYIIIDILIIAFLILFYYYIVRHEIKSELMNISNKFERLEKKFENIERVLLKEELRLEEDIKKIKRLKR